MKDLNKIKQEARLKRRKKIRSVIKGTKNCPRFSVFRSNKYVFLQLIDDLKGETLVSFDEKKIKSKKENKTQRAFKAGELFAKKAIKLKIGKVLFDRNGYKYHGRIKAVAEGAKKGGLKF